MKYDPDMLTHVSPKKQPYLQARAGGSHQSDTVWLRSAETQWTFSGSCAWQSETPQRRSGPSGSSHSQTLLSAGPYRICWTRDKIHLAFSFSSACIPPHMYKHIHISKENMELPKEKVISEFIIRIPRGSRVTVVHQNVPPVESDMRESVTKTWMLE